MDYLEQIQIFNRLLPNSGLNASGVSLWYGLMYIFSTNGWKKELCIPTHEITAHTTLSRFTVARAREKLSQLGLIRCSHQSGVYHVCYEILPLSEEILQKIQSGMLQDATSSLQIDTSLLQADTSMLQNDTPLSQKSTISENAYKVLPNNNIISKDNIQRIKENQKRKKKVKPTSDDPANPAGKEEKSCAKKERKGAPTFKQDEWLASLQEPWQGLMRQWMEYKAARKESYKTEVGARKCMTMLQNLSGNNPQVAQLIIDQSIGNNYAGLFALRQQNTASRTQVPQTGQRIGQIKQPETEEKRKRLLERFAQSGRKTDDENK